MRAVAAYVRLEAGRLSARHLRRTDEEERRTQLMHVHTLRGAHAWRSDFAARRAVRSDNDVVRWHGTCIVHACARCILNHGEIRQALQGLCGE